MKMAGNGTALHLLVILLAFSHLISLNAVMASRPSHFLHENQDFPASEDTTTKMTADEVVEDTTNGRMLADDYTGPNNKHTPRMPPARD